MGLSASIQKFVDELDTNSKYYYLLLFIQAILIVATIYVKREVAANQSPVAQAEIHRMIQPENPLFQVFQTDFFK